MRSFLIQNFKYLLICLKITRNNYIFKLILFISQKYLKFFNNKKWPVDINNT